VSYIAGLSGMFVVTDTPKSSATDAIETTIAHLNNYIMPRNPAYFCYGSIIQPCVFADRFSYVYKVCCLTIHGNM